MERIRQAIEQAAKDRVNKAGEQGRTPARAAPAAREAQEQTLASEVRYTQTKTINVSPASRERHRLVAGIPGHPLRDTYRMLRTQVLQEMKANDWSTIAVTSPSMGCGKTLTAINLAISLAMDLSHLVLLVDGDLRNPKVHTYFDYEPEYGLTDFLFKNVPVSDIMFHPDIDRLTVLPGRASVAESAEAMASPKALALLQDLRTRYSDRIIVVDVPPVLSVDDALSIGPNIDCMLMVAENGKTTKEELYKSLDLLDGIPIIGTVLNKSDKKVGGKY